MFEKLKSFLTDIQKVALERRMAKLAEIEDPFAREVEWTPVKCASANFETRTLREDINGNLVFAPTWGARMFAGVFIFVGAIVMLKGICIRARGEDFLKYPLDTVRACFRTFLHDISAPQVFLILFGLIFATAGVITMYYFTKPAVFERSWRRFTRGFAFFPQTQTDFDDIHALQILSATGGKGANVYQINMVLRDRTRIHAVSHIKKETAVEDARRLGRLMEKPVWDII